MERPLYWLLGIAMISAVWWFAGHPGWETREQESQRIQATQEAATPKLYRWKDGNGVTQITDTPPKGRKYTVVSIREDQNIIESEAPEPEPSE
ncbi:MAG: DUF4124 domain-containing protein [Arenimonas sp.]